MQKKTNQITDERLKEIAEGKLAAVLTEGPEIARELLALRERNRRLAIAILSGNQQVVYREYAWQLTAEDQP